MNNKNLIINILLFVTIISLIACIIILMKNKNNEINVLKEKLNSCEEQIVKEPEKKAIDSMDIIKKKTFALEALTAIEAANTYFMNKSLSDSENGFPTNDEEKNCVSISTLIKEGYFTQNSEYEGKVVVQKYNNKYLFTIYLHNSNLMVNGKGTKDGVNVQITATDDNTSDVITYNESLFDKECHSYELLNN